MKHILFVAVLLIISIPPTRAQEAGKPIVSVLDFTGGGASEAELVAVTNLMTSAVFDTGIVEVVDRSKRQEILSEIAFSLTGCTNESCAAEVGKLLAADIMIVGSISRVGSKLSLNIKALDVSTSKISGTFYKLYNNLDEIVDNIHSIGGQIVQNFTGKLAEKKAVLQYEELALLTVESDHEGAMVFVDGISAGRIKEGKISKAVNRTSEVTVMVRMEGYYDYVESVGMEGNKTVFVELQKKILHRFAFDAVFGGGVMGSIWFSVFPVANWWYVSLGVGATVPNADPLLINIPFGFKTGSFIIFDDRKRFRPYVGAGVFFNLLKLYEKEFYWMPKNLINYYLMSHVLFPLHTGIEYKLRERIRITADISLFPFEWIIGTPNPTIQFALGIRVM